MTKNEINNINVNDVLINITTREIIVIKEIFDMYFNCVYGDKNKGKGSIPKAYLESPSWYSLMKER